VSSEKSITEAKVEKLNNEVHKISRRERQRNIVIFGVKEGATEKWTDVESHIAGLASKLGITQIDYDQAFRLGKRMAGKTRPILVKLLRTRDRLHILGLRNKLKGSKIFISEDKDQNERMKDKILRNRGNWGNAIQQLRSSYARDS
jgi:hypothetical protein